MPHSGLSGSRFAPFALFWLILVHFGLSCLILAQFVSLGRLGILWGPKMRKVKCGASERRVEPFFPFLQKSNKERKEKTKFTPTQYPRLKKRNASTYYGRAFSSFFPRSGLRWLIFVHYGSFCFVRKSLENLWGRKGRKGTNGKLGFPLSPFLRFQERSKGRK